MIVSNVIHANDTELELMLWELGTTMQMATMTISVWETSQSSCILLLIPLCVFSTITFLIDTFRYYVTFKVQKIIKNLSCCITIIIINRNFHRFLHTLSF